MLLLRRISNYYSSIRVKHMTTL